MKISEILQLGKPTLSFEFFPPKTPQGRDNLFASAKELLSLNPDFFSVTYGAGGSTTQNTLDIVCKLQREHSIPVMHHFTCTKHTRNDIRAQLIHMHEMGIDNILALRGDPPADETDYQPGKDEPRYAFELIKLIREFGDWFSIGVAVFPETHPEACSHDMDSMVARVKQHLGAQFGITQLFFDAQTYANFATRMHKAGVTMPLIPGILPVTNYPRLIDFCKMCHATIPQFIHDAFEPIADDLEATREKGIKLATDLCDKLIKAGAPGLHFYCLNKAEPVKSICKNLASWR